MYWSAVLYRCTFEGSKNLFLVYLSSLSLCTFCTAPLEFWIQHYPYPHSSVDQYLQLITLDHTLTNTWWWSIRYWHFGWQLQQHSIDISVNSHDQSRELIFADNANKCQLSVDQDLDRLSTDCYVSQTINQVLIEMSIKGITQQTADN